MPMVDGKYQNPGWQNGGEPAIDASELNAMSETLERVDSTEYVDMVLLAESWHGYEYSFEDDYPSNQYNLTVSVSSTASVTQYDAFSSAKICGDIASNTVVALGTVPQVDIPIIVKAVRK